MVNYPSASPGQLPPAYLYGHYFGFEAGGALGQVGLVTNPDGKFAVFSVVEPDGTAHNAVVAFDWKAGRFYFPVRLPARIRDHGVAWVYDHTAATWTADRCPSPFPLGWGKLAPASITAVPWSGPSGGGVLAATPGSTLCFYAPFGLSAATGSVAAADRHRRRPGGLPAGVHDGRSVGPVPGGAGAGA